MPSKVTVVIPTFQRCESLERAIESVISQSYTDWEIVVVDDNIENIYTSCVERILDKKRLETDNKIRKIVNPGQGPASARNTGIKTSQTEYIAFLDDDDYWKSEKLERQIEVIKNPNFKVCHTALLMSSKDQDHIVKATDINSLKRILSENLVSTSSVLVKKAVLEEVDDFSEDMKGGEDWHLWTKIVAKGYRFKAVKEDLTVVNLENNSITSDSDQTSPGKEKYTEKWIDQIESNRGVAARHYLTRGIEQFEFKNFDISKEYLLKSLSFRKTTWQPYIFLAGIFIEKYMGFELIEKLVKVKHKLK